MTRAAFGLPCLLAIACGGGVRSPTVAPAKSSAGCVLYAHLAAPSGPSPGSNHAAIDVAYENQSASAADVNLMTAGSAILGFAVFDATGAQVHTIPPGMPPAGPMPTESIPAGQKKAFYVDLNVFLPPLKKGTYTVRAAATACTDTLTFSISE